MKIEKIVKKLDFSKIFKPYENKWVALSSDRKKIVASGETLQEVILNLEKTKQSREKFAFAKVLPLDTNYAPYL